MGRLPLSAAAGVAAVGTAAVGAAVVGAAVVGAAVFAAGCTCAEGCAGAGGTGAGPDDDVRARASAASSARRSPSRASGLGPAPRRQDSWPDAVVPLTRSPSATRVDVWPDVAVISNHALVDTWPVQAIERAQRAAEPGQASWPRVTVRVPLDATDLDPLVRGLETARRAERASSGAGRGSRVLDLRVSSDVSFSLLRRILYASGRAGYGHPRLLLGASEEQLVTFDWGRASSAGDAPTLEQIRLAMRAIDRGESPSLPQPEAPRARVVVGGSRPLVFWGAERRGGPCALISASAAPACLESLSASAVVLEANDDISVGTLVPWWQHLDVATRRVVLRRHGADSAREADRPTGSADPR